MGLCSQKDVFVSFTLSDPATGKWLATVPDMDEHDTAAAIEVAQAAWPAWRELTAKVRDGCKWPAKHRELSHHATLHVCVPGARCCAATVV